MRRERKLGWLCSRLLERAVAGFAMYARRAWSVSLVTRPRQTSDQRASMVSPGKPEPMASWRSAKKVAPERARAFEVMPLVPRGVRGFGRRSGGRGGRSQERAMLVGEVEGDAAVAFAE